MTKPFRMIGAYTALVTPFANDARAVDFEAFERHVQAQIEGGINGLVPCGTTGESPTLSDDEQLEVIARTVKIAKGRVPVVAGAGSNSTHKTIKLARAALDAGADAVMIVMPYYNKPSQEGLYQHVVTVAREIGGAPLVLYNIPPRCVVDLSLETLQRIVDAAPNVVAVKDATGNVLRCQQVVHAMGQALSVMCGDDGLTVAMMACGAQGVISVTSNVLPAEVAELCRLMHAGQLDKARALQMRLLPVHEAMFVEPNPAPAKAALAHLGAMNGALRLPLVTPSASSVARITQALESFRAGAGA